MVSLKTILSVCSDSHLTLSRSMLLRAGGYAIFEASDCRQALAQLASTSFDLILIDRELSEADTEKLFVAAKGSSSMAIILLTSRDCSGEMRWGAHLVDSHEPQDLMATVDKLIGSRKPRPHLW